MMQNDQVRILDRRQPDKITFEFDLLLNGQERATATAQGSGGEWTVQIVCETIKAPTGFNQGGLVVMRELEAEDLEMIVFGLALPLARRLRAR